MVRLFKVHTKQGINRHPTDRSDASLEGNTIVNFIHQSCRQPDSFKAFNFWYREIFQKEAHWGHEDDDIEIDITGDQ